MMIRSSIATMAVILTFFSGCATPVPPSGGPPDETPPEVVETHPERGAVNVEADAVRITFSEYVDAPSLPRALSISPAFTRPLDFSWSGRTVEVRFPEPLRENTTYVLTLDTNLRDARNVGLRSPIIFAFSTGATISTGEIAGHVVTSDGGAGPAAVDVFAYARPDSTAPVALSETPAYATQTDESGAFGFEYLTEQFYYVIALEDANRNRRPDPQEAFAPPPYPAVFADSAARPIEIPWIVGRIDTTAPDPLRVQSLSARRHALRFSEPVRLLDLDASAWELIDSASTQPVPIETIYQRSEEPRDVVFTTPALDGRRYSVAPSAVVDTVGNAARSTLTHFTAAEREDTLQTRFLGYLPAPTTTQDTVDLARDLYPGVRFNVPPGSDRLTSVLSVENTTEMSRTYAALSSNGTVYEVRPEPELQPGEAIAVSVNLAELAGPDTVYSRLFRRLPLDDVGEISGVLQLDPPADSAAVVQLIPAQVDVPVPEFETLTDPDGTFIFRNLPAGTYRLRAFIDRNANGRWDPGRLIPYQSGERMIWRSDPVRVRARWETALPDTLRAENPI